MAGAQGIRAGRAYVELGVSDKLTAGLRRAQMRLKAFSAATRELGAQMLKASAVAAVPMALATRVFVGFADRMAEVKAITGATGEEFERLNEMAKKLGSTTSFTAAQAAEGMKYLGMAGYNTEQILAGIPAVLNLARAGAIELGEAADIASDVGSAFGLAAEDIEHIADVMATTATSANTSVSMMGETLKYAAPLAAAAGQSLEETAAAIGVLGNNGIKASMAGTDLAMILKKMAESAASKKIEKLGVAVADSQGRMRSLVDVMDDLGVATKKMTEKDRLAFFANVFGRAAKSASILTGSSASFQGLAAKIQSADGAAAQMAATMQNTLGGSFRVVMSAVEGLGIELGEAIAGPLRVISSAISNAVSAVSEWVSRNQAVVAAVSGVAVAVAGVGTALVSLGMAAQAVAFIFGGIASVLPVISGTLAALMSPIALVVAGVAGIGAAIFHYTGAGAEMLDWLGKKFHKLHGAVGEVLGGIRGALGAGDINAAAQVMWAGLRVAWETGIKPLRTAWDEWRYAFGSVTIDAFAGLQSAWINVRSWFEQNFADFSAFIGNIWASAWAGMESIASNTVGFVAEKILNIQGALDEDFDVETAKAALKTNQEADRQAIARRKAAAIEEAARVSKMSAAELETREQAALEKVVADRKAALEALGDKHVDRIEESERKLEEAKKKLVKAIAAAKKHKTGNMGDDDSPARPGFEELQGKLTAGAKAVEGKIRQAAVVGTFNASVIGRIGQISTIDNIAKSTERTARAIEKVERHAREGCFGGPMYTQG